MGYIYKITNSINGKIYVGVTVGPINVRWNRHKFNALHYHDLDNHSWNMPLYRSMRKYGVDKFIVELLEEVDNSEINEKERYWIRELNTISPNGYNVTIGGNVLLGKENPVYGHKHSEEFKKRLSKMRVGERNPFYGKKHSEETKKIISEKGSGANNWLFGKHQNEEAKQKMSAAKMGKKASEETKKLMSEQRTGEGNAMYGKHHSEKTKRLLSNMFCTKHIKMFDKEHKFVQEFETMRDLYEFLISSGLRAYPECVNTQQTFKQVSLVIRRAAKKDRFKYEHFWTL